MLLLDLIGGGAVVADSTKVSTLDTIYIRRGLRPCADDVRLDARHCIHNASLPYHQAGGPIPATHPGEKAARAPVADGESQMTPPPKIEL